MSSTYKLNKQGDNIQPWHTPFPIWNQSVVPCPVLTVASWPAYRFLKRQIRWSGIPVSKNFPQFVVIHTVKGFGIVSEAEIAGFLDSLGFPWSSRCCQLDLWFLHSSLRKAFLSLLAILWFSTFQWVYLSFSPLLFDDPADVDNLISGSSVFSESSLNIWKFMVHVLLKPGLENFEHYFGSMWDEYNSAVVWHCLSWWLEWKLTFSSPMATAVIYRFAGILSAALSQQHFLPIVS